MTTRTVEVTTFEERRVRAAIRREGGFVLKSTIIGNVVRDGQSLGAGFRITHTEDPR